MTNPYDDILPFLHNNHIYPDIQKEDGKITGLQVRCAPILRDSKLAYLKKLLPEGFSFTAFTNDQEYILITKKKSSKK